MLSPATAALLLARGANPRMPDYLDGTTPALAWAFKRGWARARGRAHEDVDAAFARAGCALGDDVARAGTALTLLASLMNHEEAPNAVREFVGSTMFVRAARALDAGSELTTCYGVGADLQKWGISREEMERSGTGH